MKKNMGKTDRVLRILAAAVVAILFFTKVITGVIGIILLVVAAVFVLTSFIGVCPLYYPFGISSIKRSRS